MSDPVTRAVDPTATVLSESALAHKGLCDYDVVVATGCHFGCKFCNIPVSAGIRFRPEVLADHADVEDPQREWGDYVLYREHVREELPAVLDRKRTWRTTRRGCGVVGISLQTDAYMDGRVGAITRAAVETLVEHGRPVRVQTRNPILALQDRDVFEDAAGSDLVVVGSSVPHLDRATVDVIEPRSPAPEHRLRGLRAFRDAGVPVYVAVAPTYPTQDRADLRAVFEAAATLDPTVVFHEPANPRGANFELCAEAARTAGRSDLATAFEAIRDREVWADYAVRHLRWAQELGAEFDLPVHLWPDKQLLDWVDGPVVEWLAAWRERQTPERWPAARDPPSGPPPDLPAARPRTTTLTGSSGWSP